MQSKESNIKLLLLGRAVSLFGNTIYLIVLPLYILNITQNLKGEGDYEKGWKFFYIAYI